MAEENQQKKASGACGRKQGRQLTSRSPGKKGEKSRVEISAGGIVFRRTPKGVRVALLLDPFGKWAFAKGHVEKGETIRQAAVRETMEEMGLKGLRVVAPLGKIDFWFRDQYRPATRGTLVHKYVHFFLMEAPRGARGRPQQKEKIRKIIWVPVGQLRAKSSYGDVKAVIDGVLEILRGKSEKSKR